MRIHSRVYTSSVLMLLVCAGMVSRAQISFTSAIDLALQTSLRVKMAQDNVTKAAATLSEAKDVYIPSVSASSGLGASSGITLNVPTIFTVSAQSLVFNDSQPDYIRAARLGVRASDLTLAQTRQEVEEDTAVAYLSLDVAKLRQGAMADQYREALKLVSIVQDRFGAGLESELDLKKTRRIAVQLRLQQRQLDDQTAALNDHLARLLGMQGVQLETLPESIPPDRIHSSLDHEVSYPDAPDVLSADANAGAKLHQAFGDSGSSWKPQLMFQAQYGRISPFNGVSAYYNLNGDYNTLAVGLQIQLPLLDRSRKAKARQSMSDALHAEHESSYLREQQGESRLKMQHSLAELADKYELAKLDQGIAQDQLEALLFQSESGTESSTGPPVTPKEVQNARIQERQKYLDSLDTGLQLRVSEIYLLRQTGELEQWIASGTKATKETPQKP